MTRKGKYNKNQGKKYLDVEGMRKAGIEKLFCFQPWWFSHKIDGFFFFFSRSSLIHSSSKVFWSGKIYAMSTLDARGLLARQRRGASERVVSFSRRFATRLRSSQLNSVAPKEKKPLAPRVSNESRSINFAFSLLSL